MKTLNFWRPYAVWTDEQRESATKAGLEVVERIPRDGPIAIILPPEQEHDSEARALAAEYSSQAYMNLYTWDEECRRFERWTPWCRCPSCGCGQRRAALSHGEYCDHCLAYCEGTVDPDDSLFGV